MPRKGSFLTFDRAARPLFSHIVMPVLGAVGRAHIAPTIHGAVAIGPMLSDPIGKSDSAVGTDELETLLAFGDQVAPRLMRYEVTSMHAGLIPASDQNDLQIQAHPAQRLITVGAIGSRGLTASMAIAEQVAVMLAQMGLDLDTLKRVQFDAIRGVEPDDTYTPEMLEDRKRVLEFLASLPEGAVVDFPSDAVGLDD